MFIQDATPDTSVYMIAGYVVFFVIATVYLISLVVRSRNLALDMAVLDGIEAEARSKDAVNAREGQESSARKRAAGKAKRPKTKKTMNKIVIKK